MSSGPSGSSRRPDSDPDLVPRILHRLRLRAPGSVEDLGALDGHLCELRELRERRQCGAEQRLVPDQTGGLPGEATDRCGCEIERLVRDPGIGVHTPVVLEGLYIIFHMRGLRILTT